MGRRKSNLFSDMSRPKKFLNRTPPPKITYWTPKSQIQPHNKDKIEKNIENESCLEILVYPKKLFVPYSHFQNSPLGQKNLTPIKNSELM